MPKLPDSCILHEQKHFSLYAQSSSVMPFSLYPAKTQSKNCGWLLTSAQVFNSTSLLQPPVSLNFLQIGFRSPILQVTTELVVAYWHWTLFVLHIAHEVHSLRKVHKKLARPTGNQTFSCALLTWQTCFSSSEISL